MNRKHAFPIALLLGAAIAAGAFAATRGGGDAGAQAAVTPLMGEATLAAENARLDRYEATLDRLIARARRGNTATGATFTGAAAASAEAASTPSWDGDDHGDDDDGDDERGHDDGDDSGHGSDDHGGHEDDD